MFRVEEMTQPLFRTLADLCRSIKQCNDTWVQVHEESLEYLEGNYLPQGSGFDAGCSVRVEESGPDRLIIDVPFHFMDEYGGYRGWWDTVVEVVPKLDITEFDTDISMDNMDDSPMEGYDLEMIAGRVHTALSRPAPRYVGQWMDVARKCGPVASQELIAVVTAASQSVPYIPEQMAREVRDNDEVDDVVVSDVIDRLTGSEVYEWVWTVGPNDKDWGVDVRVEVLYLAPEKAHSDKIDEPYVSFTMDASTPKDGLIERVGPDTVKSLSPVVIHDDYQLDLMWDRMEERVGRLTKCVLDYIQTRLEEEDEDEKQKG